MLRENQPRATRLLICISCALMLMGDPLRVVAEAAPTSYKNETMIEDPVGIERVMGPQSDPAEVVK